MYRIIYSIPQKQYFIEKNIHSYLRPHTHSPHKWYFTWCDDKKTFKCKRMYVGIHGNWHVYELKYGREPDLMEYLMAIKYNRIFEDVVLCYDPI